MIGARPGGEQSSLLAGVQRFQVLTKSVSSWNDGRVGLGVLRGAAILSFWLSRSLRKPESLLLGGLTGNETAYCGVIGAACFIDRATEYDASVVQHRNPVTDLECRMHVVRHGNCCNMEAFA